MACSELAGLRLALMNVLGIDDEAARSHDLAEVGQSGLEPGPVRALCGAANLDSARRFFRQSLADLDQRVAGTELSDAKRPYLQTLVVLTKQVELELDNYIDGLKRLYRNLEEIHDFVHEIYPGG